MRMRALCLRVTIIVKNQNNSKYAHIERNQRIIQKVF